MYTLKLHVFSPLTRDGAQLSVSWIGSFKHGYSFAEKSLHYIREGVVLKTEWPAAANYNIQKP
jgi:hypothetical protein